MPIVLILNPASGASTLAENQAAPEELQDVILAALRTHGIEPEICYTTPDDAGYGLAQQAAQRGADIVIAAGGDGTVHAVAAGLIGTNTTLGIIPVGTMNNVAHSLEIPTNIEEACAIIARGFTGCIDVGKINDQIFLEVAGIGIESVLFPAAEDIKRIGLLSTVRGVFAGLASLLTFRTARFFISFDGKRKRRFRALQISICNSPYYGAHLQFAPDALMDDGLLDVLIYTNFSKLEYILHALAITQGRRALTPKLVRRKIKTLSIRSASPMKLHADGVPVGETPAMVRVLPGALRVCMPAKVATGPNLTKKRTRIHRQAQHNRLFEEKGPLHVS